MSILEFLFRPKIKAKKRGRRSFRPELLDLENRQLLDAGIGYIWNTDPASTTVGGHFAMQATQENGLPYAPGTVASTTWTITGAYSGYTVDNTGYHPQVLQTVNVPGDTISGYWNEAPGTHAVGVTVNFVQPTIEGLPIYGYPPKSWASSVEIAAPTVTTQTYFGTTNLVTSGTSTVLYGGSISPLKAGITTNIDLATPNGAGGSFGVIQTLDPTLKYYVNVNGYPKEYDGFLNPDKSDPGIFLDKVPSSPFPYYNGIANVGTTLRHDDLPRTSMNDPRTYRMDVTDNFTDTIMYTPPGGMPVPVSAASWGYNASVVRNSDGTPIFSPFRAPTNPGFLPGPTGVSGWASGSGVTYPQWNANVDDYMPGGNIILTNVPLSAVALFPTADLANYFLSIGDTYIPFVQYSTFTSYDYPQLVLTPTSNLTQDQPSTLTSPYNVPPPDLNLIPDWSGSPTTTSNIYYGQYPPTGYTNLVPISSLPAGTEWWNMLSTTVYDPVQDTDLFYVWMP